MNAFETSVKRQSSLSNHTTYSPAPSVEDLGRSDRLCTLSRSIQQSRSGVMVFLSVQSLFCLLCSLILVSSLNVGPGYPHKLEGMPSFSILRHILATTNPRAS